MTTPSQPTIRIFISHSSQDNQFGSRLAQDLREALGSDNAVWYDSKGGLSGGDAWWTKIVEELKVRNVFIVVLSPDATASKWVNDEISIAWKHKNKRGILIIPILYRQCEIRDDLDILQVINFQEERDYDDAFQKLLKALGLVIDQNEKQQANINFNQIHAQQIIRQIETAYEAKDWVDVIRKVKFLLKRAPESITANIYGLQGVAFQQIDDTQQAQEAFDIALALVSDHKQRLTILWNYTDFQISQSQWKLALPLVDEALHLTPQDTDWTAKRQKIQYNILQEEGLTHHNAGKYKEAIAIYDRMISLLPNIAIGYEKRSNAFIELKEYQSALADLNYALKLDPKRASAFSNRGRVYNLLNNPQQALQDINRAIELDPHLILAYWYRGEAYCLLNDDQRALNDLNKAIALGVYNTSIYCSRGITLLFLKDYQRAIRDLNQAIVLNPSSASAYLNRGEAYRLSNDYQQALIDLNHSIELDANNPLAYCCRGATYLARRDYEHAIQDLSIAINIDPLSYSVYRKRGEAYLLSKDYQRALADFNSLIGLAPEYAEAYYKRGQIYYALKNYVQACQDFDHAMELDPYLTQFKYERNQAYNKLTGQQKQEIDALTQKKIEIEKRTRSLAEQPTATMGGQDDPDKTIPYSAGTRQSKWNRLGFAVGTRLDPGIKRKHKPNEDSLFAAQWENNTSSGPMLFGLFVIADGMGGHANGQDASRSAIQTIIDFMLPRLYKNTDVQGQDLAQLLPDAVQHANQVVHQRNVESHADMGTTITATLVAGATAYVTNVGDSRTYLYRGSDGLRKVTNDHSVVASLVEAGIIKPDDIYTHPKRNQIYRSLGEKATVEVDSFVVQLQPGDKLLLCSDGLWDMVRDPKIEGVVKSPVPDPKMTADALIQAALEGGGEDNVSVIVVSLTETPQHTLGHGIQLLAKPDAVQMPQL